MKTGISIASCMAIFMLSCGQSQNENKGPGGQVPEASAGNGKQLFINNCMRCHSLSLDKMGPRLAGVMSRWHNDTTQIITFIKDPQQTISSGQNAYASQLYGKWNGALMPSFSSLSDAEIKDILAYIDKGEE